MPKSTKQPRYSFSSFFTCCLPKKTITTFQIKPLNTDPAADNSLTPSPDASLKGFLLARGMSPEATLLYAQPMAILLNAFQLLATSPIADVNQALAQWQHAFADTPLDTLANESSWPTTTHFASLDSPLMQLLRHEIEQGWQDVFTTNVYAAVLSTYEGMNTCRQKHNLLYHQPRHAAEMFEDIHRLLKQHAPAQDNCHLLAVLSALFHDIWFTCQRVLDERASAEALKRFLEPSLKDLPVAQQNIVKAFIDLWIVGATIPCFLSKNRQGQNIPTLISLAKLSAEYFATLTIPQQPDNILAAALSIAHLISAADIQRTCFPELHGQVAYTTPHWQTLSFLFDNTPPEKRLAAQLRLTQNLRALAEMHNHDLYPFVKTIATHQNGANVGPIEWDQPLTQNLADLLAKGPLSEVAFAQRMANSHSPTVDHSQNEWSQHSAVLTTLQQTLNEATSEKKREVVSALAAAAADQHGNQLDIIDIQNISYDMQTIAGLTSYNIVLN